MTHLYSQTIPIEPWVQDNNRSQLADGADAVFEKLRADKPLVEETKSSDSSANNSDSSNGADSSNGTDGSTGADGSTSDGTTSDGSTYDAATGVITQADGTLIDKETNGIIDPETGAIRSQETGQFIGLANRYIEVTYCGVKY